VTGPAEVALSYLAALNAHDPDAVAALVTDDFVNEHTSSLGSSLVGRDAYRARLPGFLAMFEGLAYEAEDVVADGDRVVVAYTLRARAEGPDGVWRPVELRGVFRFVVREGLLAHRVDYWDSGVYLAQVAPG
jgi:ketosteroid isomerase-like protein